MITAAVWALLLMQASPWNDSVESQRGLRELPSQTGNGIDVTRDSLEGGPQVTPFQTQVAPDGSIRFSDRTFMLDRLGVDFDVTDWVERLHGRSPYRNEQMAIADATREQRIAMAVSFRRQSTAQALAALPGMLAGIWAERRLDTGARKRVLLQLWDECAEQGPPDVVQAGMQARAVITSFIRQRLPPGSPSAFSTAEIDVFNAHRASTQRFNPYR